jgi:hypothetical protein
MKNEKSKEVPMTGADVKQHKRMAAGEKVDGQKLPATPSTSKTPA